MDKNILEGTLSDLKKRFVTVSAQLSSLDSSIGAKSQRMEKIREKISSLNAQLSTLRQEYAGETEELQTIEAQRPAFASERSRIELAVNGIEIELAKVAGGKK